MTLIIIAISLSIDAFSLSLLYGTEGINKKDKIALSIIVGIYHFIMPLVGLSIGLFITNKIIIKTNILIGIIFLLISIEMILSSFKNKEEKFMFSFPGYLLFGLSVSIDSLTTGIGIPAITNSYIISALIFSITSFIFTYFGLNLGNILNLKYGKLSTLLGGIILFILGIIYIFK